MQRSNGSRGLAKWLLVVLALVACATTPDGETGTSPRKAPSVGSVALPITVAASLPGDLGARLGKTCAPALTSSAETFLFGRTGAPAPTKAPQRIVRPPTTAKPLSSRGGQVELPVRSGARGAARASVGDRANVATKITSADGTMEVGVSLRGAVAATASVVEGLVVYPGGHPLGDVVQRATGDGTEDWLLLPRAPQVPVVELDVALSKGVAAVRQVGGSVELLDASGAPRLRMAPPRMVDDDCKVVPVEVSVTGCTVDRSSAFPVRRPHAPPAAASCRIALSWPRTGVKYPASLDPSWASASSMSEPRAYHTATKLGGTPDRVLVVGGVGDGPWYLPLATAEIYDAESDTWSAAGSLATPRYSHAATTFGDGTVMVAGGMDFWRNPTATAESFTGTGFVPQASMPGAAAGLTLDPLSPDWAIAAGGYRWVAGTLQTVADAPVFYKPANQWYVRTLPGGSRAWHASIATSAGVTFFGGERSTTTFTVLSSVERYNSGVDTFSTLPAMPVARTRTKAALLPTGAALLAGGETTGGVALARTDSAPLVAGSPWTSGPELSSETIAPSVTAAADGAIVTGGYAGTTVLHDTTILANTSNASQGANLKVPRYAHTATATSRGVLVVGGVTIGGAVTDTAEIATSTVCNEGDRRAPVAPYWGATTAGWQSATHAIVTGLFNSTTEPMVATLALRGEGLDGRYVSRTVWSGTIGGGVTVQVPVAPADFPVQSVGSKSLTTLVATITDAPTMPHVIGVHASSARLASSFDATYTSVELTGSDDTAPSVLEGVASSDDIEARMGPLGLALQSVAGRVWDGAAFVDVSTLAPTTDESGGATIWRAHLFSGVDKTLFDTFPAPTWPPDDEPSGMRICAKFRVDYLDDARGESIPAGPSLPASFARIEVFEVSATGVGKRLYAGEANSQGCAPRLEAVVPGGAYLIKVESRLRSSVRNVDVNVLEPSAPARPDLAPMMGAKMFSISPTWPASSSITMAFGYDLRLNAAATIGQILSRASLQVPAGTYRVHIDQCQGRAVPTDPKEKRPYTACFEPGVALWLGKNEDSKLLPSGERTPDTHNTQWKFVIAHEFGHAMLYEQKANPRLPESTQKAYDAPVSQPACRCDHVLEEVDQSHCMQSKEFLGDVETEALAHMIAANTWNDLDENACTFVYYKNVALGLVTYPAPVSLPCHTKEKWLENKCLEPNRGVEWDWMNWMRSLNVRPMASRLTASDIGALFAHACGGDCEDKEPTPTQIVASARTLYGINTEKALAVEVAIDTYGANH